MSQRVDFCDVSHWNGWINWTDVAALNPGLVGVIAKCSQGTSFVDEEYQSNRAGALAAGLCFAAYHFVTHGNGDSQAEFFVKQATPVEGERMVLDFEPDPDGPDPTIDDLRAMVGWFKENRPDIQLAIYGASFLTDAVNACGDHSFLDGTSLWAARYSTNEPSVAKAWDCWTAWQFSDDGEVEGIDGSIDVNVFNGTPSACLAWFGPAGELPEPMPEPEPEVFVSTLQMAGHEIVVTIGGGLVQIYVDGKPWMEA